MAKKLPPSFKKFEGSKADKAADKKSGTKEGSKKDMAQDKAGARKMFGRK